MFGRICCFFTLLSFLPTVFNFALAEEPTVAEKARLRTINQIKKNFEETIKATPTLITGQALLPDGLPAVGYKLGGFGRSITHTGYGHFMFETVTDQEGRFFLNLYRPCQYWITIDDPNHVHVAPDQYIELTEQTDGEILFQMKKAVLIEGTVIDKDKDKPIANMPLWLMQYPNYNKELTNEERREMEKQCQLPREIKTDAQGRFQCAALHSIQYLLAFDSIFDMVKPKEEEEALYTRTLTPKDEPIRLEFRIPSPWFGTLLQKDGTPAIGFPVGMCTRFWNGSNYMESVTDNDGRFWVYRPIKLEYISVNTFDENQWFYQNCMGKKLPPDTVFQLYTPLTATGRLVRQSTGEPIKNLRFLCSPSRYESVTSNENGEFEIKGIYLNRKTILNFINPPDDDSCSLIADFKTFTPTIPDQKIELGTIELKDSGRLNKGTLENLPGKTIEIEGVTLDGKLFDWKKYQGKVVLIEFWATWCGPCLQEIPNLKTVYEKYHNRGFEIIGISVDEDLKALEIELKKHNFPWPILADQKWRDRDKVRMYDQFAIRGVPRGILVDRNGKVITIETRGEALETELKKLFPTSLDEATTYEEIESYVEFAFAESRKNLKTEKDHERFLEIYPPIGIAGAQKMIALGGSDESLENGYSCLLFALSLSLKKHPENAKKIESLRDELQKMGKFPDLVNDARFYLFYHQCRLFDTNKSSRMEFDALKEEAKYLSTVTQSSHSTLGPMTRILELAHRISQVDSNTDFLNDTLEELVGSILSGPFEKKTTAENTLRGYCRRMVGMSFDLWGKTVDDTDFQWTNFKGKVVLIMFTASWCGPCKREMPIVVEMYEKYHDQGLEVVCIGYEDKTENLKQMMKESNIEFTIISEELAIDDPRGLPSDYYGIFGIPTILLIGRDGRIAETSLRGPTLRDCLEKQFADKNVH